MDCSSVARVPTPLCSEEDNEFSILGPQASREDLRDRGIET